MDQIVNLAMFTMNRTVTQSGVRRPSAAYGLGVRSARRLETPWFRRRLNAHPFNGHLSGTTRGEPVQKGKTNLDFTEARDSEWQRHQLGRMQVCTSLQTDNHASNPPLSFLTVRMPFLPPNQQRQSTEGQPSSEQKNNVFSCNETIAITTRRCIVGLMSHAFYQF